MADSNASQINDAVTPLKLNRFNQYNNLLKIKILGDGNCFFHAVLRGFSSYYSIKKVEEKKEIVMKFRSELADLLAEKDASGVTNYSKLSRGELAEFSKNVPQYTLENMQNELRSNSDVDYVYIEFISDIVQNDIYIIDEKTSDIYVIGDELDLYYKNRSSIILLFTGNHYDLIAIKSKNGAMNTVFSANYPFIILLKNRLKEKIALGSQKEKQFEKKIKKRYDSDSDSDDKDVYARKSRKGRKDEDQEIEDDRRDERNFRRPTSR